MIKTLITAAISAALAAPLAAVADDDATTWPDKARPSARTTPRADEAMSGNSAAASGSTRPNYDPPLRPNDAKPAAEPSQSSAETTAPPHSPAPTAEPGPAQHAKPTGE